MPSPFLFTEGTGERIHHLRFFRIAFFLSLLLIICQAAFPAWRVLPLIYGQTAAPLHYNIHFGVDTIGVWWRIFTVPVIGGAILLLNTLVARVFFAREKALAVIAAAATLFLEAILLVAMVFIVILNISYG